MGKNGFSCLDDDTYGGGSSDGEKISPRAEENKRKFLQELQALKKSSDKKIEEKRETILTVL